MTNRNLGELICFAVLVIAGYELLGLTTSLPTISRVLQGWRDGPGSNVPVWIVVIVLFTVVNLFAAWLLHHLLFDARSTL